MVDPPGGDAQQGLRGAVLDAHTQLVDVPGAIAAFRKLPKDYPDSILRDDALYELAATHAKAGQTTEACRAIADLRKQSPDSKYTEEVSALGAELKCP